MPRKSNVPLEPVTLNLVQGDREVLQQFYPSVGYGVAIRAMVHNHTRRLQEQASRQGVQTNDKPNLSDAELSELLGDGGDDVLDGASAGNG